MKRENQKKADAARPILELQKDFGLRNTNQAIQAVDNGEVMSAIEDLTEQIQELKDDGNQ